MPKSVVYLVLLCFAFVYVYWGKRDKNFTGPETLQRTYYDHIKNEKS